MLIGYSVGSMPASVSGRNSAIAPVHEVRQGHLARAFTAHHENLSGTGIAEVGILSGKFCSDSRATQNAERTAKPGHPQFHSTRLS